MYSVVCVCIVLYLIAFACTFFGYNRCFFFLPSSGDSFASVDLDLFAPVNLAYYELKCDVNGNVIAVVYLSPEAVSKDSSHENSELLITELPGAVLQFREEG